MADILESLLGDPLDLPGGEGQSGQHKRPSSSKKFTKLLMIIVLSLVLLAGLAFGGWRIYKARQKTKQASRTTQQTTPIVSGPATDTLNTTELKTYTSDTLNMQISYPADWTAVEKDGGGGLTITSPAFTYTTVDKGSMSGNFRVYIRQGARTVDEKYIGQGVAIQPSDKLVYAKPGATQRKDTYFTQFGSLTSDHFTFFMVSGDFNLKKEDTLGPTYGHEVDTYIIVGGYSSKDLTDDLAFNNVPTNIFNTKRAYTQAVAIVKSLHLN